MFDKTTSDCKLFTGSLNDLYADCKGVGYAREPATNKCNVLFAPDSANACYVSVKTLIIQRIYRKSGYLEYIIHTKYVNSLSTHYFLELPRRLLPFWVQPSRKSRKHWITIRLSIGLSVHWQLYLLRLRQSYQHLQIEHLGNQQTCMRHHTRNTWTGIQLMHQRFRLGFFSLTSAIFNW